MTTTTSDAAATGNGTPSSPHVPSSSKRSYGPIVITLENVQVPPEKLNPSPSMTDGLDEETETFLRVGGSELIQTSGILLKLPQTAMATGQVLFQRFYYSKSFVRQPMEVTAMACIYLASKIEEAPRRIRDVINVFHHIRQIRAGNKVYKCQRRRWKGCHPLEVSQNPEGWVGWVSGHGHGLLLFLFNLFGTERGMIFNCLGDPCDMRPVILGFKKLIQPLILDPTYVRLKNDVMLAERRVLKELGFCVHVKHPHKIIVIYLQQLSYDQDKNFVQMSWNYMNDALRTNVFVRFTPEAIACACIFLSARLLKIPLPMSPAWFLVFDVTEAEVAEIASNIVALYDRPAINYEELEKKVDVLAKAYQEMREKGKSSILSVQKDEKPSSSANQTPESRPSSPSRVTEVANSVVSKSSTVTSSVPPSGKDNQNEAGNNRRHRENGDTHSKKGYKDRDLSPAPKRSRRSPSPITFNNNSSSTASYHHHPRDRHRSPNRHKHKKRKKSKYSSSRSESRSRSREGRSSNKKGYRNRSRSPVGGGYKEYHHHNKKSSYTNTGDRYKGGKERNYN